MARLARLTAAEFAHHVIQRGNDRQPIFREPADQERLLALLAEYAAREKVAIHAYVLMPNHFHLLLTPQTSTGVSRLMQAVGRVYVQYFNRRHHRTGTLWEGRYRSTMVQTDRYCLACMAYIDLNPVRAGLVRRPEEHPWSSHGHYRGIRSDKLVTAPPVYWQLGNTPFEREARYGDLVEQGLAPDLEQALTEATLKGWALGDETFLAELGTKTARRLGKVRPGRRPSKPLIDMP
ncbi:putative transposase [Panacagrimonas perspica]|uniref:Putative transposase n=1 Tax=Panacagrimonas perspica TaxID=381431 RepID=A0A4R7P5C2_9GAMM|nr:transposase [Panacagrimonas perspica]TDU28190.1 putative transposase [Panacagrimonas perspica]THD01279.1 transposase [Panacagrimonas perspica]